VFVANNKAYIIGGAENNRVPDVWEYDPTNNTWTKKANYPGGQVIYAMAFSINNIGYVTGGAAGPNDIVTNKTYAYDPIQNSWTSKAPLPVEGREQGISFALNSRGYCGLGDTLFTHTFPDLYSYEPATNTWRNEVDFPGG